MLANKANELKGEMMVLKDELGKFMANEIGIEEILATDPAQLEILRRSFNLLNSSTEFMVESARAIDEINRKLDLLLSKD